MNGNSTFRHQNVALLSATAIEAPQVVTSDELEAQLTDTLTRLRMRPNMLAGVAGVKERRWWGPDMDFVDGAATAGAKALAEAGVEPSQVGLLINTSVTRTHLEPAVSVSVHNALGLPSSAMNFDVTNACLGFVNAITLAATMIDAGQIEYALIVGAEGIEQMQRSTIERLNQPGTTRRDLMNQFASLTLGCGAAAAVLGRADRHPGGHRIVGGVSRAGTSSHELCVASLDDMRTDASGLLREGLQLVHAAWDEALGDGWDWTDMDRYVMHQVSDAHIRAISEAAAIDQARVPLTYPFWGNVGPAALPMTLAHEVDSLTSGDRVLCMGVGSGLNTAMVEIAW